jgi:hypothetical protein
MRTKFVFNFSILLFFGLWSSQDGLLVMIISSLQLGGKPAQVTTGKFPGSQSPRNTPGPESEVYGVRPVGPNVIVRLPEFLRTPNRTLVSYHA